VLARNPLSRPALARAMPGAHPLAANGGRNTQRERLAQDTEGSPRRKSATGAIEMAQAASSSHAPSAAKRGEVEHRCASPSPMGARMTSARLAATNQSRRTGANNARMEHREYELLHVLGAPLFAFPSC
jgi:hypothetical protein